MSEPLRDRIMAAPTGYELLAALDDPEYNGACPCTGAVEGGLSIQVHCWRPGCDQHKYAGVHVTGGDPELSAHIARTLTEMDWYGEYTVSEEPYR